MPRLQPRLLAKAARINPLLPKLLPTCRDIQLAQNELRWLREHAQDVCSIEKKRRGTQVADGLDWRKLLRKYVAQRGRGKPLQYIIGTQPFGELDILCQPGVLIPRADTEHYVENVCYDLKRLNLHISNTASTSAQRSNPWYHQPKKVRVLDICTGTGCIALETYRSLLHNVSSKLGGTVEVLGIDNSQTAVELSLRNREHNMLHLQVASQFDVSVDPSKHIDFQLADLIPPSKTGSSTLEPPYINNLLMDRDGLGNHFWDVLISNPPYVSRCSYDNGTTASSVRRYEPISALIPTSSRHLSHKLKTASGDEFYPHLIDLANFVQARLVVFEIGDTEQANRVAALIKANIEETSQNHDKVSESHVIELWQDHDTETPSAEIPARAVVWWRSSWAEWRHNFPSSRNGHIKTVYSTSFTNPVLERAEHYSRFVHERALPITLTVLLCGWLSRFTREFFGSLDQPYPSTLGHYVRLNTR